MDIGQILANFGFDWRVALANTANFLVIVWILRKFALKPIEQKINEREDKIKKGIEDAERSSSELQMAEQTSKKMGLETRNEANRVIALAQKESEKIIAEGKLYQEEQARQIMIRNDKLVLHEKEKMLQGLRKEMISLVVAATRKFIEKDLSKEQQERIIEKLIEEK